MKRILVSAITAGAMAFSPVAAQANDVLGGIVGGIIGGAIANSAQQSRTRTVVVNRNTAPNPARAQNREVQNALNYFGFNAGGADGVLGSRSRAAISTYQAYLGYPVTGNLTEFERTFLVGSWQRAQAGGATTATLVAQNPDGVRGLLKDYRDEQAGTSTASVGGRYGLPAEIARSVNEIAASSDPSAQQLVQRHGFIQLADINGDGRTDYIIDTSVTGSAFWCNAQSCAVRVFASTPEGYERNDFQAFNVTPAMFSCTRGTCSQTGTSGATTQVAAAPAPVQPAPAPAQPQTQLAAAPATAPVATAVPSVGGASPAPAAAPAPVVPQFFAAETAGASMESHCNMVSLVSATNGGLRSASTAAEAQTVLGEQMCLARTYAIARGEELMARVPNLTPAAVAQQCAGMGQALTAHVAAASVQTPGEVMTGVGQFVLSTGMAPQQLQMTAEICLSAGYKQDDMDTAIGSALLLVALGQAPYAELVGHHLGQGFGAAKRADLSGAWYARALDALDAGTAPVFGAGQPERVALLRKAVSFGAGAPAQAEAAPAVPVFAIQQ